MQSPVFPLTGTSFTEYLWPDPKNTMQYDARSLKSHGESYAQLLHMSEKQGTVSVAACSCTA